MASQQIILYGALLEHTPYTQAWLDITASMAPLWLSFGIDGKVHYGWQVMLGVIFCLSSCYGAVRALCVRESLRERVMPCALCLVSYLMSAYTVLSVM